MSQEFNCFPGIQFGHMPVQEANNPKYLPPVTCHNTVFTKVSWVCKYWCRSIIESMKSPRYNICTFLLIDISGFLTENTAELAYNVTVLLQSSGQCSSCLTWLENTCNGNWAWCGGGVIATVGMSLALLKFPVPSAGPVEQEWSFLPCFLCYWPHIILFLRTVNMTMLPLFSDCYRMGFASSSFCRLKLSAFLEHVTRRSSGGHWGQVTASYWSKWWALSQALCFCSCWNTSSFQRILLFVSPHSFRRWHRWKKFPAAWSASHHHPSASHLWSYACDAIPFFLFLQVSI